MRSGYLAGVLLLVAAIPPAFAAGQWVSESSGAGTFPLVQGGRAATLVHDPADHRVVAIATQDLSDDIERVTGVRPVVQSAPSAELAGPTVIVGTLGRSRAIDDLVRRRHLDVRELAGAWESFVIATVPGDRARRAAGPTLVIVGSDRRGTAFGIYELAQAIGVSPWYWWADVAPDAKRELHVAAGRRRFGPPSVKYRGIFINDEDWGLHPWAAKTFDPERGDIGPKTYAKIFELLLRLKANTCWPAMHEVTGAFNSYPENRQLADDYAIVMGSSHAEPMLRNNVTEWTAPAAEFNYTTNRDGVLAYWDERVRENGRFENIYTLGMRGIHDSPMQGAATVADRVAALERIFADQRELLARHVNPAVDRVPQMFSPYKEVLDIYRAGLRVPDDVTVVWPDDNHGYIRDFPNDDERRRAGGFGVYYHLSYLGAPLAYLWLYTTPPALVREELTKAHALGARTLWIANVGDIKPAEIGIELFLQLAWDVDRWPRERVPGFLDEWAAREFGAPLAPDIGRAMGGYFALNHQRRPEHLQWWLSGERIRPSALTPAEITGRLARFAELGAEVERMRTRVPSAKRDAFFELVEYPIRGSGLANERFFAAEEYTRLFNSDPPAARAWGARARAADAALTELTRRYNEEIAGGKWRHIMSVEPADGMWRSFRAVPPVLPSAAMVAPSPTTAERRTPEAGSRRAQPAMSA